MPGFCVATSKRAQLISRCRHFCVQQPEHSTPSSGTAVHCREKLFFPLIYIYIYIFFFCLFLCHFPRSLCAPLVCALTKFSLRVLCDVFPSFPAFPIASVPLLQKTPGKLLCVSGFTCCGERTMGCGFFSVWFLSYFFCARILQIIGLVSLRVQCLLALLLSLTPPTPDH